MVNRMDSSTGADCLFCKIRDGEIPARKVREDDRVFAFEDINPQAPAHVLVVPRRHFATLDELPALGAEGEGIVGRLAAVAAAIAAERGFAGDGWRLVFNVNPGAGQSVFHVHAHLLGGRPFGWPPG